MVAASKPSTSPNSNKFELVKVCPKGHTVVFPKEKTAYQAIARLFENVYADIGKNLRAQPNFKWNKSQEKLLTSEEVFLKFVDLFNTKFTNYELNNRGKKFRFPSSFDNMLGGGFVNYTNAVKLINCAYELAIPNPQGLSRRRTVQTYGETSFEQMASIIDELKLGSNDVFLDMGSGIGQLVLLTAAITDVKKSFGIEINAATAKLARKQAGNFSKLLRHFGKKANSVKLFNGSFLEERFFSIISEATVIMINNFAFDEELQKNIMYRLAACKDGTRIISTKLFTLKSRSGKTTGQKKVFEGDVFENITYTEPLETVSNNVSWTGTECPYFLTTIRRTPPP